ncbi:MAG: methyltransferase domain-containing protein, partial [Frankiales bacterium]|nr:methyltransferase domain-containing protein [Frankiales bacterium]
SAADQWRRELAGWAIPDEILAAAPEPPWGFPAELFGTGPEPADGTSYDRAVDALRPSGVVLDVGCGGGAAGLALAPPATRVVGVDESAELLRAFSASAADRGIERVAIEGRWPAVAAEVEPADVVVCHHVLYNVPDLEAFVVALTSHARRRVVVELTDQHPLLATADLWRHFHGIDRPAGPTAALAAAVIRDLGLPVHVEGWSKPARPVSREVYVRLNRRRLCLPVSAEPEVERQMPPTDGPRRVTTLWWETGP